jgi:hypothetical protein
MESDTTLGRQAPWEGGEEEIRKTAWGGVGA